MKAERGFVLIGVVFALFVIASASLVINREGGMNVRMAGDELAVSKARGVAQAGINHLLASANQSECENYPDITAAAFGEHSYSATISPTSGSPVRVSSVATLDDGTVVSMEREQAPVYQAMKPGIVISSADGAGKDSYISDFFLSRNSNFGTASSLSVGDNALSENYSLFKFDLSSLPDNIKILSADMQLYLSGVTPGWGAFGLSVHRMLTDWTEAGVSWNTYDGSNSWNIDDNYEAEPSSKLAMTSTNSGSRDFDMTALVQAWNSGMYENYGVVLLPDNITSLAIDSGEASDPTRVPTLTVRYTCECGLYCETSAPLPDGLAHWKFDETSGTVAEDSVGGHHGNTSGTNWSTGGQIDGSAEFDGLSDYIYVPHSSDLSFDKELSISVWVNLRDPATGSYAYQSILGKGTSNYTEEYWFGILNGLLEFGVLQSGNWHSVATEETLALQPGIWYHLVATFSSVSNEVNLYLDGLPIASGLLTVDPVPKAEAIQIGRSQYGEFWNGKMDDLKLFAEVLSPEQVISITVAGGKKIAEERILDQFNTAYSYAGDDGSLPWNGSWQEVGENDGPASGDEYVSEFGTRRFAVRLQDNDNGGEGIEREADLTACNTAWLDFDYMRRGLDAGNWYTPADYVAVSISTDGIFWTELDLLSGPANDALYFPASYDISAFISPTTRIRFRTSPNMGSNEGVYIDNVEIRLFGCH